MNRRNKNTYKSTKKDLFGVIKLISCVCIVLAAAGVKMLFPNFVSGLRTDALAMLGGNVDYEAALSVMGEAVSGKKSLKDAITEAYEYAFTIIDDEAVEVYATEKETEVTEPEELEAENNSDTPVEQNVTDNTEVMDQINTPKIRNLTYIHSGEASPPEGASYAMAYIGFDYCMPVDGTLTSGFGYRDHPVDGKIKFHYGTDFGAEEGTDILSFGSGTVYAVGESSTLGLYVMIDHEDGVRTVYGHCSQVMVSGGDSVKTGEKIAEVGSTGNATGNCLHFEIEVNGVNVDPEYYLTWV